MVSQEIDLHARLFLLDHRIAHLTIIIRIFKIDVFHTVLLVQRIDPKPCFKLVPHFFVNGQINGRFQITVTGA